MHLNWGYRIVGEPEHEIYKCLSANSILSSYNALSVFGWFSMSRGLSYCIGL